jgi:hypothetical protein
MFPPSEQEFQRVYLGYCVSIPIDSWNPPTDRPEWFESWVNIIYCFYPEGKWKFIPETTSFHGVFLHKTKLYTNITKIEDLSIETYPGLSSNPEWIYHTLRWIVQIPNSIELPFKKTWFSFQPIEFQEEETEWDTWGQHIPSLEERMGKQLTLEEISEIEEDESLKDLQYEQTIEDVTEEPPEYSEPSDGTSLVSLLGGSVFRFSDE